MRGAVIGFAVFIGLMLDVGSALAQNPYGVGGYLDRQFDLGEESDAEQARQARRRPADSQRQQSGQQQQPQGQQSTQGVGQGPSAAGATQQPGAQGNPSYGPSQGQQQRRPAGAQSGPPQQQFQQQQQRPAPVMDQRRARPMVRPSQEAAERDRERERERERDAERADAGPPLPPLPLRRPEFIEPPAAAAAAPVATAALPDTAPTAAEVSATDATQTAASAEPAAPPPSPEMQADIGAPQPYAAAAVAEPSIPPAAVMTEAQPPADPAQARVAAENPAAEAPAPVMTAVTEPAPPPAVTETATSVSPAPLAAAVPPAPAVSPAPPAEIAPAAPLQVAEPAYAPAPPAPPVQQAAVEPAAPMPPPAEEAPKPERPRQTETAAAQPSAPLPPTAAPVAEAPAEPTPARPQVMADVAPHPAEDKQPAPAALVAPPQDTPPVTPPAPVASVEPAPAKPAAPPPAEPAPVKAAVPSPTPAPVQMARVAEDTPPVPQAPLRETSPLDRMIGQMLLVGFRGLTPEDAWTQKLAAQIKAGTVGGVLIMSHNVQSPPQLKALTGYLAKAKTDIPLLLAVDQEGGIVQRLSAEKGFQTYPTAGKLGQSNDPLTAYSTYGRLATELTRYGFNMNLGPVVDLNRNEDSPIIAGKERSFGALPKHVAAFAKAFMMAHQEAGVLTVLKHFPGHGSTPFDTHTQPVALGSEWNQAELEPYNDLIAARVAQAVMVGHIAAPSMSEEPGLPASLSARSIQAVLRKALGFNGVVISDDLEMGAIRARYSLEESAVKAIKAGNDMIILSNQNAPSPEMPERIVAAIRKAVESGDISREALQASYDRIIGLKQQLPGTTARGGNGSGKRAASNADRPKQAGR